MWLNKMGNRGGIGIDFLIDLFIVGGIGFYIFLQLWNVTAPTIVTQANNLEGSNDAIVLLLFYLVPVAVIVRILKKALKDDDPVVPQ